MQELYVLLFVGVVAIGAYFAFKKPKKENVWMGHSAPSGGDSSTDGETGIVFSGDTAPVSLLVDEETAPQAKVKKSTKPRKKYGTRITKAKK